MADAFEENKVFPQWVGWTFVIVLSAILVGWGLLNYTVVKDAPRQWDFGQLPQTPAESEYSTSQPSGPAPPQMLPMPEVQKAPGTQGARP